MEWYSPDGERRRLIEFEFPREPVSDTERSILLSRLRQLLAETEDELTQAYFRELLSRITFCDPKAFWFRVSLDESGYVWARYAGPGPVPSFDPPLPILYRVFNQEGEYLGDTQWPVEGTISRGHLLTIQEDADTGIQNIVVYRIRSRIRGFTYPN